MAETMRTEGRKLQGTAISTTMTFEGVKSAEQMKAAASQSSGSGGGGLSGMLARRVAGNRGQPQQRSKVLTTTHDMLSIDTTVTSEDVAIPAGFKEKK
jgi:mevalonate kinase